MWFELYCDAYRVCRHLAVVRQSRMLDLKGREAISVNPGFGSGTYFLSY